LPVDSEYTFSFGHPTL